MNTTELVAKLSETHGVSKAQAKSIVDDILKDIVDAAASGAEVSLPGFGKFKVKAMSEREGRNPANGEKIKIAASKKLTFSSADPGVGRGLRPWRNEHDAGGHQGHDGGAGEEARSMKRDGRAGMPSILNRSYTITAEIEGFAGRWPRSPNIAASANRRFPNEFRVAGSSAMARAMPTRWRWPPENSWG